MRLDRQLGRGRNRRRRRNVHLSRSAGSSIHHWRRLNHVRLGVLRRVTGGCRIQLRRRFDDSGFQRRSLRKNFPFGRRDRDSGWSFGPGDDIRQRNVVIQLQIGRRHDRLPAIIGLPRNRKDWLWSISRLASKRWLGLQATCIQRRQEFGGLIVDYVFMAESSPRLDSRLPAPDERSGPHHQQGQRMIESGLAEAAPRNMGLNKDVRPEACRFGSQAQRRLPMRTQKIRQVATENARPGRKFNEQTRAGNWPFFEVG